MPVHFGFPKKSRFFNSFSANPLASAEANDDRLAGTAPAAHRK
jgi:hypothetical protein